MIKDERNIIIYTAGPIDNCTDDEVWRWRDYIQKNWLGRCLHPPRRDYRGIMNTLEGVNKIVTMDKLDIAIADVVLANYWKNGTGTAMEIIYSWGMGKLVVVRVPDLRKVSPWIIYHSHYVTEDMDDALKFTREYYAS